MPTSRLRRQSCVAPTLRLGLRAWGFPPDWWAVTARFIRSETGHGKRSRERRPRQHRAERLLVPDALKRGGGFDPAYACPCTARVGRATLEHREMASFRGRLPASQCVSACLGVPGPAHPDGCARQLRADLLGQCRSPLHRLLPAVLAGLGRALVRLDAGGDHDEPGATSNRTLDLAHGALALLCQLADCPAARLGHGL